MIKNVVLFLSVVIIDFIHSESCTRSCDCFNENAGDVHVENGEQSCCSGTCKLKCDSSSQCDDQYDRYKGGECFTKDEHPCPSSSNNQDTNCGNQVDGTTSRNVNGECVRCNSGSFAADNSMNCAVCTAVVGALSTATYTCTNAFDSRVSACAASSTTKKTVGTTGADTCTASCAAGTWDNSNVCTACAAVTGAKSDATYTCISATTSRVSACAASSTTKKTVGSSDAADTCTAQCAAGTWDNANVCSSGSDSSSTLSPSPSLCSCPSSWLADGTCDSNCNNAACNYDNGDCKSSPSTTKTSPAGSTSSSYCVASSSSSSSSSYTCSDGAGCKWDSFSSSDWGYLSETSITLEACKSLCDARSSCAGIEHTSDYCSYWKSNTCSSSHSSWQYQDGPKTCFKQSSSSSSSSSKKSDGSSCSYDSDCSSGTCDSDIVYCDITADCSQEEMETMMKCMEDIDLYGSMDSSTSEEMCATMVEVLKCYDSCICRKACFQDQIKSVKETCDTNACSSLGAGDSKSFDGLVLILILLVHLTFG